VLALIGLWVAIAHRKTRSNPLSTATAVKVAQAGTAGRPR